jgi:hypothetical protein
MDIKLIIFSACSFKRKSFTNSALAAFSNRFAQKHGYKTVLYTDARNYEVLKNVEYDDVKFFDEKIINKFPSSGWSLGKLLAMSMTHEPFIHIDFDMLMINDVPPNIKTNECFVFHQEPYMKEIFETNGVQKLYQKYNYQKELNYNQTSSNNCAIIGGQNYQLINDSCNKVIDYAVSNRKFFEEFRNLFHPSSTAVYIPVFFEQILLLNIIREKTALKTIPTILESDSLERILTEAKELKLFHLWGNKQKFLPEFIELAKTKNISF